MPRELGLHTFISPFYFIFSSSDIASHGGGKCDMKKKKKTNKKCSHLLRAQSHAQRIFFCYQQHTRNKVKKEILCLSSGCSQSPTDMRGKCIRITWALKVEFPFSTSSVCIFWCFIINGTTSPRECIFFV